jgi:enoyl-CoA hydratase/carnithine racemase/predicted thioesterase
MKSGLGVGYTGECTWVVDPSMTITLGDLPQATVFATPHMIMLMERAAREALRPFLEDGEESVGAEVQVEHLAPAVLGETVRGAARVTGIDGRRVSFEVQAFVGQRELGRGTHRRAVIHLSRLLDHLAKLSPVGEVAVSAPDSGSLPTFATLQLEVEDRIALVTLNRPRVLNAVNVQMTSDLEQLASWLSSHSKEVRVVIVTGEGDAFCAGDDLKELPSLSIEDARQLSLRQANLYLGFERLPQLIVAAVNGHAMGAGCVLANACDLRLASHAAAFGMPEIQLGWPPGYGVAQLIATVGKARALEMCLQGRPISAREAHAWGLVNELVPGAMLMRRARELAEAMLALPAEALRETKRLVHADEGSLPKVTHRADTEAYIRCLELSDAREGLRAFAEKRPARFEGP